MGALAWCACVLLLTCVLPLQADPDAPSEFWLWENIPLCRFSSRAYDVQSTDAHATKDTATYVSYDDWIFWDIGFGTLRTLPKVDGEFRPIGEGQWSWDRGDLGIYYNNSLVYTLSALDGYMWVVDDAHQLINYNGNNFTLVAYNTTVTTTANIDFSGINCTVNCCNSERKYAIWFNTSNCDYLMQVRIPADYEVNWPLCTTSPNETVNVLKADCKGNLDDITCKHGYYDSNCNCVCLPPWVGDDCQTCPDLDGTDQDYDQCVCTCHDNTFWAGDLCEVCELQNNTALCQWYGITAYGLMNSNCTACACFGGWTGQQCNICPLDCGDYGEYDVNCTYCTCENSWEGANCEICPIKCTSGFANKECTDCQCPGLWGGTNCDVCTLHCNNNGIAIGNCSQCSCVDGWQGPTCSQKCGNGIVEGTEACDSAVGCSADCLRILTGYKCTNGLNCEDIDECADKSLYSCDPLATCVNTAPGYQCVCPPQPTKCVVRDRSHYGQMLYNTHGDISFGFGF